MRKSFKFNVLTEYVGIQFRGLPTKKKKTWKIPGNSRSIDSCINITRKQLWKRSGGWETLVASFPSYLIFLLLSVVYCVLVCGSFFLFLFSPGIGMEMREILFQSLQTFRSNLLYTIYYMPSPKARSRSFFFVYFLFCYFFCLFFFCSCLPGPLFFFSFFVSLLFVCGPPDDRLGGVIGSVVPARVLYRIVEDLLPPV